MYEKLPCGQSAAGSGGCFAHDHRLPPGGPVVSAGGFREEALDAGVRAAVRAQLGIAGDTALTQADMEGLERLSIRKMGVKSLEGLEYAVNLEWLDVSGNPELRRIPEGWLDALPALSYLNLSGSSLTGFPAALYAGAPVRLGGSAASGRVGGNDRRMEHGRFASLHAGDEANATLENAVDGYAPCPGGFRSRTGKGGRYDARGRGGLAPRPRFRLSSG